MFSSGEYTNAYASPSTEYTNLQNYYKGSQFGPKLPASVPSNGYPTILKQGNEYGYEALTHDTDGNGYYNVEKAYGNSCQPKYYVAKCPENKFLRPFVPDGNSVMGPPTPCPVKTEGIAEGYQMPTSMPTSMPFPTAMPTSMPFPTAMPPSMPTSMPFPTAMPTSMPFPTAMPTSMPFPTAMPTSMPFPTAMPMAVGSLQHLKVLFFYDKNCPHSRQAMETYQKELAPTPLDKVFLSVKDISQFNNEQLLTELGGTATPFFYSQVTNRSVTGFVPGLQTLVQGLSGKHHTKESFQSPLHDRVKKLNIVVFVMQGCGYCDKIKSMLAQAGVQSLVVFADARDPKYRQELMNVRGFPHYKSMTTGKSSTGYPGSLEKFLSSIE